MSQRVVLAAATEADLVEVFSWLRHSPLRSWWFPAGSPPVADLVEAFYSGTDALYLARSDESQALLLACRELRRDQGHCHIRWLPLWGWAPESGDEWFGAAIRELADELVALWSIRRAYVEIPGFLASPGALAIAGGSTEAVLREHYLIGGERFDLELVAVRAESPRWISPPTWQTPPPPGPAEPVEPRQRSSLLAGGRVELDPLEPDHLPDLYGLVNEPWALQRWRTRGVTWSPESFGSMLWNGVRTQFVAVDRRSGAVIGLASEYNADPTNRHSSIAVVVGSKYRRRGWPLEAAALFIDYLFDAYPLHKIYANSLGPSFESVSSGSGSVFVPEGELREHEFIEGRYRSFHIGAIYRSAWLTANSAGLHGES